MTHPTKSGSSAPALSLSHYLNHYTDVIIGTIASQITSLMIVYSTVYSDADQRKYQSSASLAFVRGIHRRLVNSPHKWPVTRKMFPFHDVIMILTCCHWSTHKHTLTPPSKINILQLLLIFTHSSTQYEPHEQYYSKTCIKQPPNVMAFFETAWINMIL